MKALIFPVLLLSCSLSLFQNGKGSNSHLVEASWFGKSKNSFQDVMNSVVPRDNGCGEHYAPCPREEPCCNNGTCHATSMEYCPVSKGCDPRHSFLEACFPLPGGISIKDNFKDPKSLVPKNDFTGDPAQAYWTSDFDHVAPHAKIEKKKLLLQVKRNEVQTKAGGGFGSAVSSTRWYKYGTFEVQMKTGSSHPGIVTAFTLTNPYTGDEISFEVTGKDPKKVYTNFYHRFVPKHLLPQKRDKEEKKDEKSKKKDDKKKEKKQQKSDEHHHSHAGFGTDLEDHDDIDYDQMFIDSLKNPRLQFEKVYKDSKGSKRGPSSYHADNYYDDGMTPAAKDGFESHEEVHDLPKDSTQKSLTYKIERTRDYIKWFVNNKEIRSIYRKDVGPGILPNSPMQLRITTWDAGYSPEASDWAGELTDYGPNNQKVYQTTVEKIDIQTKDTNKDYEKLAKNWPGDEAKKRIKEASKLSHLQQSRLEKARDQAKKQVSHSKDDHGSRTGKSLPERIINAFYSVFKNILRLLTILSLVIYFGLYATGPVEPYDTELYKDKKYKYNTGQDYLETNKSSFKKKEEDESLGTRNEYPVQQTTSLQFPTRDSSS